VSGAEQAGGKWTFGMRVIPNQISRARWRNTLTYRLHPRLMLGIEYNPLATKVSPLANVIALMETARRPGVIFGTSSDRIGTPHGQSFYGTLSKSLREWTRLPLEVYAGAAFGTYDDRVRPIGGLNVLFNERWVATALFDGVRVHTLLNYRTGRHEVGLVLDRSWNPGMSYSVSF